MIALQSAPNPLTLEAFLEMPETKPASEYINGCIEQKTMPQGKHSVLQIKLATLINQYGETQERAYGFPELRCTFSGHSIVPDIAVFEWERIPLDKWGEIANKISIAPDWIIEILSPGQSSIKPISKLSFALQNGTKLGWLISPKDRIVLVFQGEKLPLSYQKDDLLPVLDCINDWQFSVNNLFRLLSFSSKTE
jgi:Uma2 family endonuclease